MPETLTRLFEELDRAGISYCLLRDAERLEALARGGELDLLVEPRHLVSVSALLERHGFVRLAAWGHAPHHFFIHYDAAADSWLKCDVVTEVAYGRPVHNLRTDLGAACLTHRRRAGITFAPSPEEELLALLIHCVVDKQQFGPDRIARLKALRLQVTREEDVSRHLGRYWSAGMTWHRLAAMIDQDQWTEMLASRERVRASLARHDAIGTLARGVRDRLLRALRRPAGLIRPAAPSIALLAPDGAGKSTLTAGIRAHVPVPVATVYMGLHQEGRRAPWSRVPGLGLAAAVATQWRRYLAARMRQARGQLVVFDRYTYDALLPATRRLTALGRLRRWLLARSCPPPDLTIVLDAPGEVLFARKQEHDVITLERQRQAYLRMQSTRRNAVVVDATLDADDVRRAVTALIWRACRDICARGAQR